MKKTTIRVEWIEIRLGEAYRIIADKTAAGWDFAEKCAWEIKFYPIDCTAELVAQAEKLARNVHWYENPAA